MFFENPFWVGVYERVIDGTLEACKIIFGAEPKEYEVYEFLLKNWDRLNFSPPIKAENIQDKKINPKRMQRDIKKQLAGFGAGTKSQQALKLQRKENKVCRKANNHKQKEEEKQRRFELRQQKRREKHRGK